MRGLATALLLVVTPLLALAEGKSDVDAATAALTFDEIVVVATKRATSIRDVAADVTVLRSEDLLATMTTSLEDTFRYIPGVTHQSSGSRFGTEGITIRGIGGNRIALELDGVPLSDQFDIGNFSNATRDFADAGLLGQVEVMRGPASALYGGSALGGVVAMSTRDPRSLGSGDASSGNANALYRGLDESSNLQASLALHGEVASLLLSGSYRDGRERQSAALESPEDVQRYQRESSMIKLVGDNRFGHDWRLSAIRQSHDARTQVTSVLGSGRFRSTTRLEGDDSHRMDILNAEYRFDTAWASDGLVRVFVANAEIQQDTLDERGAARVPALISRGFHYEQRMRGAEINLGRDVELSGWSHRFGIGLEFTETQTEELRDGLSTSLADGSTTSNILGENFPLRDFPVTDTREFGAYISDQLSRGPLSLILALRYDDNRLTPNIDPIYAADNPATPVVAIANSDVSPKVGAIYHFRENLDLYVQYARGFRAPPFEDANIGLDIPLFNIRAIPNPDLTSETSDGWEIGMRWQGERSRLQLGAFRTAYSDFIETKVRVGVDPVSGRLLFQSINIGDAVIRGIEARWARQLTGRLERLTLLASGYWAAGDNRDSNQPLNSVGPAEAVLGASWRSADERTEVRALLTAMDAWSRRDESVAELFEPAGHAVLDIFLTRTIGDQLTLRAGIGNVTDRVYWQWSEVRGLAPEDALLPTLAEAGRNISIGLRWDW
jgi:hemoglobin/transferrin/lactoferrin receptor protein